MEIVTVLSNTVNEGERYLYPSLDILTENFATPLNIQENSSLLMGDVLSFGNKTENNAPLLEDSSTNENSSLLKLSIHLVSIA